MLQLVKKRDDSHVSFVQTSMLLTRYHLNGYETVYFVRVSVLLAI